MKEIKLIYNNVYSLIAKGKIFAKRNVYINYKTSLFKKKNFYILNSSNSKIKIVYQTRNKNSSLIFEKNALKLLNPKIISNYHIKDIIFTSIHAGLLYNLMVDDKIQINSNNMLTNYLAIGYNNDFHLCFYKEIFSSFIHSIHYKLFTKNNSNNTYFSELISTKLDYRKNKNYYLNVKKKIKSKYDHISTRYSLNYANKYSSCNSRFFFNEDLAEVKNICCLFNYVFISNSISINKEISDINYLFNQHYFNLNYSTNIKKLKSKSLSLINNYFYKRIVKKRFLYLKDCFNINELIFDKLLLKIDSEGNRVIDISDYNFAGFGLSTKNFTEYKNKKINNSQSTLKNITTTLDNISDYLFNDLIKEIQIYLQGCYFINNCSNNNRLRLLISNYNNFINLNLSIKNQFHNTSMLSLSNNYWYQQNTKLPSYLDDIDINPLCFQLNLSFYLKNKEVRFIKSKTKQFTSIYVKSIKSIVYRPYSNLYEPTLKYISNLSEKFLHIFINSRSLMKNIKSNLLLNFYLSQAMCSTHIKGNERYKKRYFIMDYKRVPLLINLVHTIKYQENRRTSYNKYSQAFEKLIFTPYIYLPPGKLNLNNFPLISNNILKNIVIMIDSSASNTYLSHCLKPGFFKNRAVKHEFIVFNYKKKKNDGVNNGYFESKKSLFKNMMLSQQNYYKLYSLLNNRYLLLKRIANYSNDNYSIYCLFGSYSKTRNNIFNNFYHYVSQNNSFQCQQRSIRKVNESFDQYFLKKKTKSDLKEFFNLISIKKDKIIPFSNNQIILEYYIKYFMDQNFIINICLPLKNNLLYTLPKRYLKIQKNNLLSNFVYSNHEVLDSSFLFHDDNRLFSIEMIYQKLTIECHANLDVCFSNSNASTFNISSIKDFSNLILLVHNSLLKKYYNYKARIPYQENYLINNFVVAKKNRSIQPILRCISRSIENSNPLQIERNNELSSYCIYEFACNCYNYIFETSENNFDYYTNTPLFYYLQLYMRYNLFVHSMLYKNTSLHKNKGILDYFTLKVFYSNSN